MRIGCSIANFNDGTSFYRGHGVMSETPRIDSDIHIEYVKDTDVIRIKGMSCCFMQRPDQARDLVLMKTIKKLNIPVVLDYDDYLLEVPEHNRYHKIMDIAGNDYKIHVKQALSLANQVWVSTQELKVQLQKYNPNVHVIRNAFDNYLYREQKTFNNTKTVLWRGSSTHEKDLELFKPQILELIKSNPDFKFVFLIDKFFTWLLDAQRQNKNVELIKAVPVFEYHYKLQELKAGVMIVPLEDSMFNRCKSDIAAIEALGTGSLCIAPDWEEWKNTATHLYTDNLYFLEQAQNAINLIKQNKLETVKRPELRLLSDANKQRVALIRTLVNG